MVLVAPLGAVENVVRRVRVMRVEKNERIVSVTRVVEQDEELDEGVIDQEENPVETADSTTETISEE